DAAEELATVDDHSIDVALCVGTLEHILDKLLALKQVQRVLRVGGVFVCLTPNGDYCWYRQIAPRLGIDTRHLSTDRFLGAAELEGPPGDAGSTLGPLEHWRFTPGGAPPEGWAFLLDMLDRIGGHRGAGSLRGGIAALATGAAGARCPPPPPR